jgi:Hemerythrin HHE cation binding domain
MSDPTTPPHGDSGSEPLETFSQCHVGIRSQLESLGQLPDLLEQAARARQIAAATLKFFREAVFEHHAQEEGELFPAVLASAIDGDERTRVQAIVARLTKEHREVEAAWSRLEPGLKDVSKGRESTLDGAAVAALVTAYTAHARYEEQEFLPLSQVILSRNGDHMAALGVALHLRHVMPEVLARYGHRI